MGVCTLADLEIRVPFTTKMIPEGAILVLSYSKVHIQIPVPCCFGLIFVCLAATMIFTGALSGLDGQPEGQDNQRAETVLDLIVLQRGTASGSGGRDGRSPGGDGRRSGSQDQQVGLRGNRHYNQHDGAGETTSVTGPMRRLVCEERRDGLLGARRHGQRDLQRHRLRLCGRFRQSCH